MAVSGPGMRNESDFARRPRGRERGILGRRMAGRKVWRGDSRASPVFAEGVVPIQPVFSAETQFHAFSQQSDIHTFIHIYPASLPTPQIAVVNADMAPFCSTRPGLPLLDNGPVNLSSAHSKPPSSLFCCLFSLKGHHCGLFPPFFPPILPSSLSSFLLLNPITC